MRLLVCGGRTFGVAPSDATPERIAEAERERDILRRALDAFHAKHNVTRLIHGKAHGADTLAAHWAATQKHAGGGRIYEDGYAAAWRRLGRAAGMIRNAQMLREGDPDAVLAFPGGRGTEGMMRLALKAGVPVWRVMDGQIERMMQAGLDG